MNLVQTPSLQKLCTWRGKSYNSPDEIKLVKWLILISVPSFLVTLSHLTSQIGQLVKRLTTTKISDQVWLVLSNLTVLNTDLTTFNQLRLTFCFECNAYRDMPIDGASPDKGAGALYSVEEPNAFIWPYSNSPIFNPKPPLKSWEYKLSHQSYFGLARVPGTLIRQIKRTLTGSAQLSANAHWL